MKDFFEDKWIRIRNDAQLLNSLNCTEYECRMDMNSRIARGTYDDLSYALALAVYGARYEPPVYRIVGVPKL